MTVLVDAVALLSLGITLVGIISIVRPLSSIRIRSRRTALLLAVTGFVAAVTFVNLHDETLTPEQRKAEYEAQLASKTQRTTRSAKGITSDSVAGIEYTVNQTRWKSRVGSMFSGQRADGEYLVLDVTLRNSTSKPQFAPEFYLVDQEGREYAPNNTGMMHADGGKLVLTELNPGVEVRGSLVFELPSKKHSVRLLARNSPINSAQ